MKPHGMKNGGFTLVELLVTVAIVGILAALCFPAFRGVVDRAHEAKCSAKLRQLWGLLSQYAMDHDGVMPAPSGNYLNEEAPSASWMLVLQDYVKMKMPQIGQDTMFLCPAAAKTYPNGEARRSYAMNGAGTDSRTPLRPVNIKRPASTAWLIDAASSGASDGYAVFGLNTYKSNLDWRHRDGLNILFLDGHVEWLGRDKPELLDTYIRNFSPASQ